MAGDYSNGDRRQSNILQLSVFLNLYNKYLLLGGLSSQIVCYYYYKFDLFCF